MFIAVLGPDVLHLLYLVSTYLIICCALADQNPYLDQAGRISSIHFHPVGYFHLGKKYYGTLSSAVVVQ